MALPTDLRIALVHDYLVQDGGAERVLAAFQELFPQAPTYTLLANRKHPQALNRNIITSYLGKWPLAHRYYQWLMPLMPSAVETLDVSNYDVILSTSSSFAKGIISPAESIHICYCHTPTRFLWQERFGYLKNLPQPHLLRRIAPRLFHHLRTWDAIAATRPDILLTNSKTSRDRIRHYYHRDAEIIPPPVDTDRILPQHRRGTYWLAGGRLVTYKRFDLVVQAFNVLGLPLKIFGTGPDEQQLRHLAKSNIQFLGYVTEDQKRELFHDAIAFLHPQIEDFGITAVEAMSAGKPVITNHLGGGAETVVHDETGVHLPILTADDIIGAVRTFEPDRYATATIRARAESYSKQTFQQRIFSRIEQAIHEHANRH